MPLKKSDWFKKETVDNKRKEIKDIILGKEKIQKTESKPGELNSSINTRLQDVVTDQHSKRGARKANGIEPGENIEMDKKQKKSKLGDDEFDKQRKIIGDIESCNLNK